MNDTAAELYRKYEKFMQIMLEEHTILEVAAVMTIQSLSIYKTFLDDEDYNKMIDSIVENKDKVKKLI